MRALLLLPLLLAAVSCATPKVDLIVPTPAKYPAELFDCDKNPGAWGLDADDVAIAVNETQRTAAGESCRRKVHQICDILKMNDQVTGVCPNGEAEGRGAHQGVRPTQ